jgi:hypothetical protein
VVGSKGGPVPQRERREEPSLRRAREVDDLATLVDEPHRAQQADESCGH